MILRLGLLASMLLATGAYLRAAGTPTVAPPAHLDRLPLEIGTWTGEPAPDFDPETERVLGADEYLNRVYTAPDGAAVGLYVGYYRSQRQGDVIHSPLNCLPGTGWQPLERRTVRVRLGAHPAEINRLVVARSVNRAVVLYWYEGRGRTIAGEYENRFWLLADALRYNRSEGALVRLMSPLTAGDGAASARLVTFAEQAYPALARLLPR